MSESAADHPGVPDGFDRLWTPHRMVYIGGQDKPADSTPASCPFCTIPARDDATDITRFHVEHGQVQPVP